MPSLAEATSKTVEQLGLTRVPANTSIGQSAAMMPPVDNGIQFSRCPVPPFSISPDSLTTMDRSGLTPQARFIASLPLFQDTSTGTTTTVTTTVSGGGASTGSGGGSSSSSTTTTVIPTNTGFVTPAISQGVPFLTSIQMSPLFILYKVVVNSPARVELYSTSLSQTQDQGRAASTPVAIGTENGIIADFNLLLSTESPWICSPAPTGFNGDNPISSTIYMTVTNLNPSTVSITVSLFYLPMGES